MDTSLIYQQILTSVNMFIPEDNRENVKSRISYKFSRKSLHITLGNSFESTKHMFVIDGFMTDVVETHTGFTWKNISRITMQQIIDEMVKSLK